MEASGACRLPTCLCASPCWLRMNTSQSGHSCAMARGSEDAELMGARLWRSCRAGCALRTLGGMRERGLAYPRAVVPRLAPRGEPLAVARSVALDHLVEL